jgi:hypothetical protein
MQALAQRLEVLVARVMQVQMVRLVLLATQVLVAR